MSQMPTRPTVIHALTGATIIDGRGGAPIRDGVILLDGPRIVEVGDARTPIPPDAGRRALDGKFIIPGLMDANVHLLLDVRLENLARYEDEFPELVLEAAQVTLRQGVTTVFDSWGPGPVLHRVRQAIDTGRVEGSRIRYAGNILGLAGPISDEFFPPAREVASAGFTDRINRLWEGGTGRDLLWLPAETLRERVSAHIATGIDFVKYAASGHAYDELRIQLFSERAQRAIVEEAHAAGLVAQSHTSNVESFRTAIDAGVDIMQHGELTGPVRLSESDVDILTARGVACAALAFTDRRLDWFRSKRNHPRFGEHYGTSFPIADDNLRSMIAAGTRLVLATDGGLYHPDRSSDPMLQADEDPDDLATLGTGHLLWLRAMEQKGLSPQRMLQAATLDIARAYRVDADLGSLEAGKIADLVVLDRDPLAAAAHFGAVHSVMKDGLFVDRDELPVRPRLTRQIAG